ncbi:hypothetical protein A0H81_05589 [Grifola frondosa]|uniref:Uncharacterized protein n=1 Tax=Grifola frondosa TaxID=5627 RepID=A0A1C7MCL9_GRIFR|nr:hypothetical protein A0H81_05589 [Grifola frondosa]
MTAEEHGVKKKKERTHESFIVVRPPPSKSNHPLNLQVQLVPPNTRDTNRSSSSRRSTDSFADTNVDNEMEPARLTRTSSNRSDVSMYSTYSTASMSTTGSTSSSSSGRRMIIPLYNLQAHNVLTNVIVDAGTDAKYRTGVPLTSTTARHPTSSAVSLTSEGTHENSSLVTPTPTPTTARSAAPDRSATKKFFGKLFNKKRARPPFPPHIPPFPAPSNQHSSSVPGHVTSPPIACTNTDGHSEPSIEALLPPARQHAECPRARPINLRVRVAPVGRSAAGRNPAATCARHPAHAKILFISTPWPPHKLAWGMKGKLQEARNGVGAGIESAIEVRFEWGRGRGGKTKRGRRADTGAGDEVPQERAENKRHSLATSSQSPSTSSLQAQAQRRDKGRSPAIPRRSLDSHRSASPHAPGSIRSGTNTTSDEDQRAAVDDGYESDPEDSETPWTCTLVVRRLTQPGPSVRVKVAAVVPTPHHPKVVALLKVPFPLSDIDIEHVQVRKRIVTPAGVARPAPYVEGNNKSPGSGGRGFGIRAKRVLSLRASC